MRVTTCTSQNQNRNEVVIVVVIVRVKRIIVIITVIIEIIKGTMPWCDRHIAGFMDPSILHTSLNINKPVCINVWLEYE